jgi:prepilin-type N-terminal cleavage/methylation domain-containing protein/prepilin-type processing-associated H-X9-DG protein
MKANFPPSQLRSRNGFTLLELLTVMTIVAMLAVVGFAALQNAQRASQRSGCLANMRQITAATLLFTQDNDQTYPTWKNPSLGVKLAPYLGVRAIRDADPANQVCAAWKCPADPRPLTINATAGRFARSYAFSMISTDGLRGVVGDGVTTPSIKTSQVSVLTDTILLVEWFNGAATSNYQYEYGFSAGGGWTNEASIPKDAKGNWSHGDTANFAFCDGHVKNMDPRLPYQTKPMMWFPAR